MLEGAVSATGGCRVAEYCYAEHVGRNRRWGCAGQHVRGGGRCANEDRCAGGGTVLSCAAAKRGFERAHPNCCGGWRCGRMVAAGDHPVRSLRRAATSARRTCRRCVVSRGGERSVRSRSHGRGGG